MLRVMIVEDEHFVRIGIKNSIPWEKYGMQVICDAENGRQALDQYEKYRPEIIITDLKMPVMGGIELIKEIRATDKRVRFIILTCLDEFSLVQEAIRLGASAYILKLTSEQEEIEEALEKVRAEWNAFSGPLPSANEQYVDRQAVNEQLLRDFLVYEKIPAENFPKLLEDAGVHIAMERLRVLMVRFPDYGAMLSRQKDPLGYQLKNVVVDLLRETMEGLVPGQVYGEHDRDFLILACFAGMEAVEEDAVLDQLVIRVKESVMRCFNENVLIGISSAADTAAELPALRREAIRGIEHKSPLPYKVEAALDYLSAHYKENFSLQTVADYVGISPNYLGHLFIRHLGVTFTEQLNKVRIEHAKGLLNNPQYMIYEVGSLVGLENTTYFTRLFKRYTGKTPRDYRKELGL